MLKKIMKAALAASLVFGMSSFAYAADIKVGGSFSEYFGQYNSGVEDESAYFAPFGESQVKFTAKAGKITLYHEMEANTNLDDSLGIPTQTKLSYQASFGLVSIGNIVNMGTIPMSGSGFKTSTIAGSTRAALGNSGYSEGHAIDLTIPLEGMGAVQFTLRPTGKLGGAAVYAGMIDKSVDADVADGTKTAAEGVAAKNASYATTDVGTSYNLGANLKFGDIGVVLGYSTSKTDDPTSDDDEAMTSANMLLGVSVALGNMKITADYSSAKAAWDGGTLAADDFTRTTMDVGLVLNEIGPGSLTLGYDMTDWKQGDPLFKTAGISAVFNMPVTKTAGISAGYIANTTTPETGDATTQTYLAGGLYASF